MTGDVRSESNALAVRGFPSCGGPQSNGLNTTSFVRNLILLVVYKNSTRKMPAARDGKDMPSGAGGQQSSPNSQRSKPKSKEATKRQSMLNTHRMAPFKYDMNEILSASQMDEAKASAFLASLIAKASRQSTRDAKDFARTYLDAGDLTKDEFDRVCRLLDKYSRYR